MLELDLLIALLRFHLSGLVLGRQHRSQQMFEGVKVHLCFVHVGVVNCEIVSLKSSKVSDEGTLNIAEQIRAMPKLAARDTRSNSALCSITDSTRWGKLSERCGYRNLSSQRAFSQLTFPDTSNDDPSEVPGTEPSGYRVSELKANLIRRPAEQLG